MKYCVGFAIHQHESTMGVHVFPILKSRLTSLSVYPSVSSHAPAPSLLYPASNLDSRRRRGRQRMRPLVGITNSKDMSLSKPQEILKNKEDWHAAVHGVTKSWTQLSDWTKTTAKQNTFLKLLFHTNCMWRWKREGFFLPFLYNYPCGFIRLFSSAVST